MHLQLSYIKDINEAVSKMKSVARWYQYAEEAKTSLSKDDIESMADQLQQFADQIQQHVQKDGTEWQQLDVRFFGFSEISESDSEKVKELLLPFSGEVDFQWLYELVTDIIGADQDFLYTLQDSETPHIDAFEISVDNCHYQWNVNHCMDKQIIESFFENKRDINFLIETLTREKPDKFTCQDLEVAELRKYLSDENYNAESAREQLKNLIACHLIYAMCKYRFEDGI